MNTIPPFVDITNTNNNDMNTPENEDPFSKLEKGIITPQNFKEIVEQYKDRTPANEWKQQFTDEFGIHFKDSSGELQFALAFIEELLDKNMTNFCDYCVKETDHTTTQHIFEDTTTENEEDCGCDVHDYCSNHNPDTVEGKEEPSTANKWREEFEKEFPKSWWWSAVEVGMDDIKPEAIKQIKDFIQNLLDQHSARLVEREHNKMLDWAETCYKRGFTDGFEEGKKDIFKMNRVQELLAVDYTVPQYEFKESEKCKNCRNLHNGSIVKVDDGGKCVFCGRKVGDQAIGINKSN